MAAISNLTVCYCGFVLNFVLFFTVKSVSSKYQLKEVELPSDYLKFKVYTDEDIAQYDGTNDALPLLIAVKGVVFDVSIGQSFYGKGAPYNALIGKDTSRAVAKMSLEQQDLNRNLEGLNDNILKALDEVYETVYLAKYPIVGYMDYFMETAPKPANSEL